MMNEDQLYLELQDTEWPFEYIKQQRSIARAIVVDDCGYFYFVRISRDDEFGCLSQIETSGGGIESGEEPEAAIRRELKEELGAETEILCKIGIVNDYYNLIHRRNINNYFLCRAVSFGERRLTEDEACVFHLSTLRLTYDEAAAEYEKGRSSQLGRLIYQREFPVLQKAKELLGRLNNE